MERPRARPAKRSRSELAVPEAMEKDEWKRRQPWLVKRPCQSHKKGPSSVGPRTISERTRQPEARVLSSATRGQGASHAGAISTGDAAAEPTAHAEGRTGAQQGKGAGSSGWG